jgi:hypothetical protein
LTFVTASQAQKALRKFGALLDEYDDVTLLSEALDRLIGTSVGLQRSVLQCIKSLALNSEPVL